MKVYIVIDAPVSLGQNTNLFDGNVEVHNTEVEAQNAARRLARLALGKSVWILEGEPVKSYRCEPLIVHEEQPRVAVI